MAGLYQNGSSYSASTQPFPYSQQRLKDRPCLPRRRHSASLNGSGTILASVRCKIFPVFTDATRGPLGAAQLLIRLRMWHLASLGAMVTVLSVFSDAAVQGSATIPLRTSNVGSASIPISTNYNFSAIQPPIISTTDLVDPSIKASLYSGVLDLNSKAFSTALTPNCPTGDCSFPPYASLAFCSECQNLTSRMKMIPERLHSRLVW